MVRNQITRRAGGSETAKRSQPGSHEVALRGLRGNRGFPLDYAQTIKDWTIKLPDNSAIINEITSYVTKNSKERINKQIGDYTLEIVPVFDNKNNKKVFSYWAITIRTQKFNATSTNNESMALSYSNADVSYPTWTNEKGEAYFLIQKPGVRGGKSRRNIKKLSRRNKSGTRRALPKIES